MIRYGQQDITQDDIDAVVQTLQAANLTQGPQVVHFEDKLAEFVGAAFARAVNSATSALHVACMALDLGPGDILWTSPNTFVASANCAMYCGASVDFVDIDPCTYNMSVEKLRNKLSEASKSGRLPKIVIPVHFAGQPCDMKAIHELSVKYKFKVIEDASHAVGASYLNSPIGNCEFSDITVFSFHPVKIITTGEGGMALTNCRKLAEKMTLYRSHGITRDETALHSKDVGPWYYEQICLGYNYRMTDIQASLGISQLNRLKDYVVKRHEIAKFYNENLKSLPLILPLQSADGISSYHLYVVKLKLDKIKASHREVFEFLRSKGILVNIHYIPVHTQPYYRELGFRKGDFPESEIYYQHAISIPMHPSLTESDLRYVVDAFKEILIQ
jgi:UDP-4-amino-4,6-dideoxy-N-acetyl-beta-L-altrosamine transaminase